MLNRTPMVWGLPSYVPFIDKYLLLVNKSEGSSDGVLVGERNGTKDLR
jgi:hypothetical protein